MQKTLTKHWLTVAGATALLAACGGGGNGDTAQAPVTLVAGTDVPVTVEQSTKGVIDFAKAQLAATSETSEPLIIGNAKLATDDAAEPSDI